MVRVTVEAPVVPPTVMVMFAGSPPDQLPAVARIVARVAVEVGAVAKVKVFAAPPFTFKMKLSPTAIRDSLNGAVDAVVAGVSPTDVTVWVIMFPPIPYSRAGTVPYALASTNSAWVE